MNIEQLDLIIQIAANPQNEEAGNALAQFNKFKQEPNAHFISVELFSASTNPNTKFVCLQVIESFLMARNVGGLLEDDIILLKKFIETHILDLKNHDKAPEYVSIKFAVVTVLFLRHTFLSCWNNFWDWIIGTLEFGSLNADMFVKILKEFDQEIVEYHSKQNVHKHNTSIKDAMRKYQPSGRTVSHEITDSLFQIISSYVESDEQLCADTLLVTAPLIVWFDLCLFVNEKFITLFIGLLQSSTCCVAASKCLLQIVKKGMPIDSKLKLISELQLLNLLDSLPFDSVALDPKSKFAGTDEYDIQEDFYIEIALVLNHIGLFILDGVRVIIKPTEEVLSEETKGMILAMVGNSYRLLRRYFISTNCAISEECLPYFETLVSCIGMEKKYNPAIKIISSQIEDVIVLLSERLKLPDWFTGSHIDEDEGHFSCFRSQVRMIFVNLTRHNTETVLSFILEIVNAGLHQMQNLAMADAELILFHVFHFGESVPRFCKTNETFSTLIKTIIGSDAWNHPHPLVIQLLMQICTRYAGILESEEQLLMKVFGHITGESGLRHADRFTRGRSCYDIMRLVQKTKTRSTSPVLRNALLNQIEPFLHIESNPEGNSICFKDKQHLFETSSVLLASVEDTETKIHLFQRISNPLLSKLEENLVNVNQIDAELVNQKCFEILSQIGHFTKGFGSPVPEMMPVFTRFFEASMQVVQALPEAKEARSKVYFLLQRLTTCTGPAIIEFAEIALPILIREACSSDMKENIRFINVLCRLKDIDVTELLAQAVVPFVERIFSIMPPVSAPESYAAKERSILQKDFICFLNGIIMNNKAKVFLMGENLSVLPNLLGCLLETMIEVEDAKTTKMAINAVLNLSQWVVQEPEWVNETPCFLEAEEYLKQFLFGGFSQVLLQIPQRSQFNFKDYSSQRLLQDILKSQHQLLSLFGSPFGNKLVNDLSALGMNADMVQAYCQLLEEKKYKILSNALSDYFESKLESAD